MAIYDPNTETDLVEQQAALHWELLRRNAAFKELAERWIKDTAFRLDQGLSEEHNHKQVHFARCALDWMISPRDRAQLARKQIDTGRWFYDERFNFGPVKAELQANPLRMTMKGLAKSLRVFPLTSPPPPLRLEQSWPETPMEFRGQFRLAVRGDANFQVITSEIKQLGHDMVNAAARLDRKDKPQMLPDMIRGMHVVGDRLRQLAEFHHIFAIPNARCASKTLDDHLKGIREHYRQAKQTDTKHDGQSRPLGTRKAWRWFLAAEDQKLDAGDSAHMYLLADEYCKWLEENEPGAKRQKRRNPDKVQGKRSRSTLRRNRRTNIIEFIRAIESRHDNIYPPAQWLKFRGPLFN